MSALPPKADMCVATAYVCFGSKADICSASTHVRFAPESGHVQCKSPCLLWAISGHGVPSCKVDLVKQRLGANHATWHPFRSRAATDNDPIFSHFRRGCSQGESFRTAYSVFVR